MVEDDTNNPIIKPADVVQYREREQWKLDYISQIHFAPLCYVLLWGRWWECAHERQ